MRFMGRKYGMCYFKSVQKRRQKECRTVQKRRQMECRKFKANCLLYRVYRKCSDKPHDRVRHIKTKKIFVQTCVRKLAGF